jgi:protein-L-isoaspartate(D-aspartate) O-methyltransferase
MTVADLSSDEALDVIRRVYAKHILAAARVEDARLEAALAAVRREDFLGRGPWLATDIWTGDYVRTPGPEPLYLYANHVFAILPDRHLNNGHPSSHATWLAAAAVKPGDHAVHIGTGTGYYTAILAHLVGPAGRVTGIEFDLALAARAAHNLASLSHVRVIQGDGATASFDQADAIYVNAGVTRPVDLWLDRLAEGGRLVLPLTSDKGFIYKGPSLPLERRGAMFRIERRADEFLARWISPIGVIPCESARDPESEAALAAGFAKGGWKDVTRLRRGGDIAEENCWVRAPGWCLTFC